jgi:hypothetical protein
MNAHSSRSHAILTVYMRVAYTDPIGRFQNPYYLAMIICNIVLDIRLIKYCPSH